jgi:alpha-L-fucosidase
MNNSGSQTRLWSSLPLLFCILLSPQAVVRAAEDAQLAQHQRADWLKEAKWGVFMHYMADTVFKGDHITVEKWNEAVDAFDVNGLAEELASAGAGYFVLTLGQNSGFYCSPNRTYDRLTGITPSKCARRDLVSDLSAALRVKHIRLMVYLPAGAPDRDREAMKALEWKAGQFPLWTYENGKPKGQDDRLVAFQKKWESVIAEWSKRWGRRVSGWWFDGCYYPDAMYRHPDAPNFASFAATARAGNPDSIVAFNPGVLNPIIALTPEEDYTAGEINDPGKVVCSGRWVGNAQFQMLSFLGPSWCQKPPRFKADQVVAFTQGITAKDGAVTWDVPPAGANGHIPDEFLAQLRAIGESAK